MREIGKAPKAEEKTQVVDRLGIKNSSHDWGIVDSTRNQKPVGIN